MNVFSISLMVVLLTIVSTVSGMCVGVNATIAAHVDAFYRDLACSGAACPRCVSIGNKVTAFEWSPVSHRGTDLRRGALTSSIALFPLLTRLSLRGAGLRGELVSQLALLTHLESLWLDSNALIGTIPSQLGQLSLLTTLALDANLFSGTLASQLGRLSLLQLLTVNGNRQLSGTLPREIRELERLKAFSWATNTMLTLGDAASTNATAFPSPPDFRPGVAWHVVKQLNPLLRFSFYAEPEQVHVMLETPSLSWVGIGFGPRLPGASMSGADLVMLSYAPELGAIQIFDSFAVSERLRPARDITQGGSESDWFGVSGERVAGITRYRLSRSRVTGDRWDNEIPMTEIETIFALGSKPGFDDEVLDSFHGPLRAVQVLAWVAPANELPVDAIVGGVIGGAALLLLLVGAAVGLWFVLRRSEARDETGLRDGERVELDKQALAASSLEKLPIRIVDGGPGLFVDPVLLDDEFDSKELRAWRAAQEQNTAPRSGLRLLQLDAIYADVLVLQNKSTMHKHSVVLHLPEIRPQFILNVEPVEFRLAPGAEQVVELRISMLCTTMQQVTLTMSVDGESYAELPLFTVESELSTQLDFDEITVQKRIGEGGTGVVFAGTWRAQPVAVKMLRQELFTADELAELKAEARLLSQLLHKNIVGFRGISVEPARCCLVTELAPFGSLRAVLEKHAPPFAYGARVAADAASGVQFLHRSGIVHRDIKPANVLVYSLSARETTVAKLTDFGSARVVKANVDRAGRQRFFFSGGDHSGVQGTPVYMAPELFERSSRPCEASDCYSLGVTLFEIAALVEPHAEIAFAWDVAKAVQAGVRPTWPPERVVPATYKALVERMWAQEADVRPELDTVLSELEKFCENDNDDDENETDDFETAPDESESV